MNSIYINPIVLSANPPRSTPPPPIQPFVSRYFLVRHSNSSNSYQQFQRTTHPQMRMQFINMSTTNYIGFPLRKSSSSNNLQQFHHQVHQINSAKDDTQQRNCSKGGQKDNKSGQKENLVSDFSLNHNQKSSHHKSKGNKQSGGSTKRNEKNTFSHPWLASTLKGHTDDIRDIDFSSNGKYLASCGEDSANSNTSRHRRPSGSEDVNSSSSSSNEEVPTYQAKPTKKAAKSRRQRRIQKKQQAQLDGEPIPTKTSNVKKSSIAPQSVSNTKRGSNASLSSTSSSASSSPIPTKIDKLVKISRALAPPLRQHTKLNLKEKDLVKYLKYYVIESHLLRMYGYPVESVIHSGSIEIFKCTFKTLTNATKPFNNQIINQNDGLVAPKKTEVSNSSGDSGQGSGTSSPPSVDSDSSEVGEEDSTTTTSFCTPDGYQIFAQYNNNSIEKQCVRCQQSFMVSESGEYLTTDECCYHWGKLLQIYVAGKGLIPQYSCCNGDSESVGCSYNPLHVWTGIVCGMNGPYDDFVHTKYKDCDSTDDKKVYALDCEMIFTGLGLEVAKVSVVSCEGQIVYEHFVRPKGQISDYNTRFSGIIESDLKISTSSKSNQVKTLEQVQRDLLGFISADTILIGHGLENDLRVLKIIHKNIIDTSISFPHANGFPYRRALKNLTKTVLKRDIQTSDSGHSSFEDSRACLELMLWKVRKELLTIGHAI